MCPIVEVLCSAPTYNTRSKKRNAGLNIKALHDNSINLQYFFALPNSLEHHTVVQVMQADTIMYNLQDLDDEAIIEWREKKKNNVKLQWMKKIRE